MNKLNIDNPLFMNLKADFNKELQMAVNNAHEKGSISTEISIKLKVCMGAYIVDESNNIVYPQPEIKHQISSLIKISTKTTGDAKDEYALIYDKYSREWRAEKIDEQQSFEDMSEFES